MSRRRDSVTGDAARIVFSRVAPWNQRLGNPYRTRWAQVGDRYFKIHADGLYSLWEVDEVDADGELLGRAALVDGEYRYVDGGLTAYAFNLADAKVKIAEACGVEGSKVR